MLSVSILLTQRLRLTGLYWLLHHRFQLRASTFQVETQEGTPVRNVYLRKIFPGSVAAQSRFRQAQAQAGRWGIAR